MPVVARLSLVLTSCLNILICFVGCSLFGARSAKEMVGFVSYWFELAFGELQRLFGCLEQAGLALLYSTFERSGSFSRNSPEGRQGFAVALRRQQVAGPATGCHLLLLPAGLATEARANATTSSNNGHFAG